jgi:hypothetical protein
MGQVIFLLVLVLVLVLVLSEAVIDSGACAGVLPQSTPRARRGREMIGNKRDQ